MKELEYLSEISCGYCLDTSLCACKRLSLEDQYFMWIFMYENWDLAVSVRLTVSSKQGKKLLKSALSIILKANKPHNYISGGGIVLVTCVVRLFLKNFFAGSDSSDKLSSDRSCQISWQVSILRKRQ